MKTAAQINAEAFVQHLIKRNQPLEDFTFEQWVRPCYLTAGGLTEEQRWMSVRRGCNGSITNPMIAQSFVAEDGDTMDAFQSAVAVAVMRAL